MKKNFSQMFGKYNFFRYLDDMFEQDQIDLKTLKKLFRHLSLISVSFKQIKDIEEQSFRGFVLKLISEHYKSNTICMNFDIKIQSIVLNFITAKRKEISHDLYRKIR